MGGRPLRPLLAALRGSSERRTEDWNNTRIVQRFERAILNGIRPADFIKASSQPTAPECQTYGSNQPNLPAAEK